MDIVGATVVVTGGADGIGRRVVEALLEGGARVAAVDRGADGLARLETDLGVGDRLSTHVVDVTDRAAVLALPEQVADALGPADALVNVAGVVHDFTPVADLSFEAMERVMDVNYWGTVNTTKAFLPVLESRPAAALVNVASLGGLVPFPGQTAYGASKAAVRLFTEGVRAEHQGTGLHVAVVLPGGTATDITTNSGVTSGPTADAADSRAARYLTSPEAAAAKIVGAITHERPRVTIGKDAALVDLLGRVAPATAVGLVARLMRSMLK
ncbi:SDR family NAD(P)-dependent oxidoreductase [Nocardioides bruguierae]|uniref:SDR family oxidoreductase n=1 Tax=Nocardioides bruguierae TaxID=2945102 RepID=A0A9X2D5N7_9ACTN|nr:SDR family oxidoreductase [Nocardioides bruguierae]MCM0619474.1 SDR family oxidoreductase [Nocardioides bruguierae]